MKRLLALLLLAGALCLLASCTDGPLVATATPEPSPEPSPEPTPEIAFYEDVIWPETSLTALLPHFPSTLEIATQTGDEHFFASFTEHDSGVITRYKEALAEYGFTVVEQDVDGLYIITHEDSDGLLKVQIFYEGGAGTIQISDNR